MSNRTAIALGAAAPCSSSSRSGSSSSPRSGARRRGSRATSPPRAELTQKKSELASPSAAVTVRTSDVFRLAKALPEDTNVAAAMLDVDRLAARHGLTLEGFQPTAQIPVQGYYAQPVTVTVQGRFGKVSQLPRRPQEARQGEEGPAHRRRPPLLRHRGSAVQARRREPGVPRRPRGILLNGLRLHARRAGLPVGYDRRRDHDPVF